MELITEVVAWFADPANWTGTSGIVNRTVEHVVLSAISVITAIVIAVPAGLFIGHTGRGAFITVTVAIENRTRGYAKSFVLGAPGLG